MSFRDERFQVSQVGTLTLRLSFPLVKGRKEEPYQIHATWSKIVLSSMRALIVWVLVFFKWFECFHNWSNDLEHTWGSFLKRCYGFFFNKHTVRTNQETQISHRICHLIVECLYKRDIGWDLRGFWKRAIGIVGYYRYHRYLTTILIWPVISVLSCFKSLNTTDTES